MHGAENAKGDGNTQAQNRGENIDKDGVLHGGDQHIQRGPVILIAVTEIALQNAVVASVNRSDTNPAQIPHEYILIRAKLPA